MPQSSQCLKCKNYNVWLNACNAFPDKIPVEIITGQFDHREPYPGDNDIRWEERESKT